MMQFQSLAWEPLLAAGMAKKPKPILPPKNPPNPKPDVKYQDKQSFATLLAAQSAFSLDQSISWNLLEMQILRPCPSLPMQNLHFIKILR